MKELNVIEVDMVCGAAGNALAAGIIGGIAACFGGALWGGTHGGNGGGILGIGAIGQGVGMVCGGVVGLVGGFVGGMVVGYDKTMEYIDQFASSLENGKWANIWGGGGSDCC